MAILNFPDNPQQGDQYTGDNGTTYIFDGVKWVGHAVAQPAGTNSITNNGFTLQIDGDGNLIMPTGKHLYYQDGTPLAEGQGPQGAKGDPGTAATITVGTVTTGIAGSSAAVSNAGTTLDALFNFTIPRGDKGDRGPAGVNGLNGLPGANGLNGVGDPGPTGPKGDKGDQGVSVTLQGTKATIADLPAAPLDPNDFAGHGWIVTTGDGGTHLDGSLWFWNLTDQAWNDVGQIQGPQGLKGDRGDRGLTGNAGANGLDGAPGQNGLDGAGVATGGVGGQILAKIDDTDFNTEWVTNDRLTNNNGDQLVLGPSGQLTLPKDTSTSADATIGATWNINLNANGTFYKFSSDGYFQMPTDSRLTFGQPSLRGPSFNAKHELITLYDFNSGTTNYGIGVSDNTIWTTVDNPSAGFAWYGGEGNVALELRGDGTLTLHNNVLVQEGNDLKFTLYNPTVDGGVSYVIENRQVDIDSKTTQFVLGPRDLTITTDFAGNRNEWTFGQDGNLVIPPTGDITRDGVSAFSGGGSGGGIFDTTYTYQAGTWLGTTTEAEPGCFATYNGEDNSSDLVQDTDTMYFGPIDANGKDNSVIYNWLVDSGVGAQIRVTDPQGNQVARLVTRDVPWVDNADNMYNGYRISIIRMWGNNTPSKSKIMITTNDYQSIDADYSADTDFSRWYINTDKPIVLSLWGESDQTPIDMGYLWTFATSIVDTFGGLATATERHDAFYSQIDTLIANAFPEGTLYKDFEFYANTFKDIYAGETHTTVTTTNGTDGYFLISWDDSHYWVKRMGNRYMYNGVNYQVGDTFFTLGSWFGGTDGVNDLTLTVTEVNANGEIKRWNITGTPPAVNWPTDNIQSGGSYQENYSNKFFTQITGNNAGVGHDRAPAAGETLQAVPYNGGQVTSGEGVFFGTGSGTGEYVVTYKSSVLALFVVGNASAYIETDGDSGSNSGHLDVQYNPHWLDYGLDLRIIEGGGSWVPGTKYTFTFDFNNSTGRIKFGGNNIYTEPGYSLWMGNYGGEGYVYIPSETSLAYSKVEIVNNGYYNNSTNMYENAGVMLGINNGNWTFRQDINNSNNPSGSNNLYIANPNNTRTVSPENAQCAPNMDTIVYTSTADYISAIKLFLMAEGTPDGAPYDNSNQWDTQATDAIVVHTPYNSATAGTPSITVYGRVYTGAGPVATFSVRRNSTTNRIEVLARPTSTTHYCYVRATATEIMSQD